MEALENNNYLDLEETEDVRITADDPYEYGNITIHHGDLEVTGHKRLIVHGNLRIEGCLYTPDTDLDIICDGDIEIGNSLHGSGYMRCQNFSVAGMCRCYEIVCQNNCDAGKLECDSVSCRNFVVKDDSCCKDIFFRDFCFASKDLVCQDLEGKDILVKGNLKAHDINCSDSLLVMGNLDSHDIQCDQCMMIQGDMDSLDVMCQSIAVEGRFKCQSLNGEKETPTHGLFLKTIS